MLFRSTQLFDETCAHRKMCREKEPIPKKKIYSQRTVEMGVYVDRHAYKKMAVSQIKVLLAILWEWSSGNNQELWQWRNYKSDCRSGACTFHWSRNIYNTWLIFIFRRRVQIFLEWHLYIQGEISMARMSKFLDFEWWWIYF